MMNTTTYKGQTWTRKGRSYSHAVIVGVSGSKPLVEWASSLELAQKNASAHESRLARVRAGQTLGGVFSSEWYTRVTDIAVVPVEHS